MAMADSRFALPPEDIDDLRSVPSTAAEGKGKGSSAKAQDEGGPSTTKKQLKRKRAAEAAPTADGDEEPDLYDAVLNGPLPSTSTLAPAGADDEEAGDQDDDNDDNAINEPLNLLPKPLQIDNIDEYNAKVDRTGIIYLSRIPPGMGPAKVKHILSHYGETGRIYLVSADSAASKQASSSSSGGSRHHSHRFVEGWVEFMDKKVARRTADLLNAKPIGDVAFSKRNKKNGGTKRWKDDVWTMKYLPRFKWNMLSEQVAVEAATRAALLRSQLAQSKKEQAEYLRQVERAKGYDKAQEKKRARLERRTGGDAAKEKEKVTNKKERIFTQREAVLGKKGVDEKLGKVLDSLF